MTTLTADQVVVDVLARTEQTKRQVTAYADSFERDMNRTKVASDRAEQAVVRSSQVQRAAYQQLGFQLSDVVAQASSGTSAFVILAQQGGQTAAALSGFGGVVGRVATFMSGPFGAAILGGITVLGLLATRSDEAATAKRKQGEAARSLKEAIEDLDAATVQANQSSQQSTRQAIAAARGYLIEANGRREATKAAIEQALANQRASATLPGGEGIAIATSIIVTGLQKELDKVNSEIAEGQKKLASVGAQNVIEATEASLTVAGRAAREYEKAVSSLNGRLEAGQISVEEYSAKVRQAFAQAEATRNAEQNARRGAAADRREATAARRAERDAAREAEAAERAYWSTVKAGNAALEDAAAAGQRFVDERLRQAAELCDKSGPGAKERADELIKAGDRAFDESMAGVTDSIQEANAAANDLKRDLASGITDAIIGAGSLGDALENAFVRAGIAALESQIFELLGSAGGGFFSLAGNFLSGRPGRASGGHVSAGKLYRVNERGPEGFQPAGSGKIIPLGRMRAASGGGAVTNISLTIPVDARGANDPAFTARVARQAVREAAPQIIETTLRAAPGRIGRVQTYEG